MAAKSLTRRGPKTWPIHACGAGLVLVVAAAFYLGIYSPWQLDVKACGGRIEQLHKLLATGDAVIENHRRVSERLGELRRAVGEVKRRMPTKAAPSLFIDSLAKTAASLGLELEQCSASAPDVRPDHTRVEVTCRLVGSYASICKWLAAVDQFPQISKVSRLEIESGPNTLAYPAQVTFQLYYRHQGHDKELRRGSS